MESFPLLSSKIQASLGDVASLIPDHHNEVSIAIKWAVIILLVDGLAFHLEKTQHSWNTIKKITLTQGIPVLPKSVGFINAYILLENVEWNMYQRNRRIASVR